MNAPASDPRTAREEPRSVLELTVNNHPGVMSHVCGLFARRAYNLEAICCVPCEGGAVSRMWLWVMEDDRVEQIMRQVAKLHDVLEVTRRDAGPDDLPRLAAAVNG